MKRIAIVLFAAAVLLPLCLPSFSADIETSGVLTAGDITTFSTSTQYVTEGSSSLKVTYNATGTHPFPGFVVSPSFFPDWSQAKALICDVYLEGTETLQIGANVQTSAGASFSFQCPLLQPGWNRNWVVNVAEAEWYLPIGDISVMRVYEPWSSKSRTYHIDNVRWSTMEFLFSRSEYLDTRSVPVPNSDDTSRGFIAFNRNYMEHVFPARNLTAG